jgi:hypothetical protein
MSEGSSLRQLTEAGTAADLQWIEGDVTFAVQINLWSLCRARPELRDKLRVLYDTVLGRWQQVYIDILGSFGLSFRPPFDAAIFARVLAALAEGLAMQRVIDPTVPVETFGWAVLALIPGALCSPGDARTLTDIWSQAEARVEAHSGLLREGGSLDAATLLQLRALVERHSQLAAQVKEALDGLTSIEERIAQLLNTDQPNDGL